jgi:hypothetical protein
MHLVMHIFEDRGDHPIWRWQHRRRYEGAERRYAHPDLQIVRVYEVVAVPTEERANIWNLTV